jgi:hypothetical protein
VVVFIELIRILVGNAWNRIATLLVVAGIASITGVMQHVVPPIAAVFGVTVVIPETPWWIGFALIGIGVLVLVLSLRRPDQASPMQAYPGVRAHINTTDYGDGWRSVQLHIMPPPGQEQNFRFRLWRISHARLIWPCAAILSRAQGDDATGKRIEGSATRVLEGRPIRHVQPFALEFFIGFTGSSSEVGRKATFRVKIHHIEQKALKRTLYASAIVPPFSP